MATQLTDQGHRQTGPECDPKKQKKETRGYAAAPKP